MKIALVILHADPARGGAERYTIDLASALRRRGHAVSILASTFAQIPDGIEQVAIEAPGLTRAGRYQAFLDALDAHLKNRPYDMVHAMLPVNHCDLYHPHAGVAAEALASGHLKHRGAFAQALARRLNALNARRRRFAAVERALLEGPRPPVVLCLSDYVKAAVRRHYRIADDRLEKLFNGIDLERFDPHKRPQARQEIRTRLNIADDQVAALIIAQDFERKGLLEAMQALAHVDPRLALIVVGREDPARYQRLADDLNVRGRIRFAGPTSDPHAFYQAADLFVLPTRHDPCSLVVLEALVMGLPVISTRQNGACEAMTPGVHGLVLDDAQDVAALAAAMRVLLDPSTRARMRAACLGLRDALSQEHHVTRLIEIYDQIARTRTP